MAMLYEYADFDGDLLALKRGTYGESGHEFGGIHVLTCTRGDVTSCVLPDDEIPALISALQNYMSRRAKEITKAAKAAEGDGEDWAWQ
jgi:hypothetical protein